MAMIGVRLDGTPKYRKVCSSHHSKNTAAKHGLDYMGQVVAMNAGFDSVIAYKDNQARELGFRSHSDYLEHQARELGFSSHTAYKNSKHPYLKYRKDYCENEDSRLGFECTTTIHWDGMLDVDHKNGKPNDNRPSNLQTLCKCCHAYKTNIKKDYKTPGRKALGMAA
jgi:hypothetical protein